MEKCNEINPLDEWISTDDKLSQILIEIEKIAKSENEQAQLTFYKLAENYNLPKFPDDAENNDLHYDVSVYEMLGKIKFVDKNLENLKSNVLFAAYLIINKFEPLIDEELDEFLGNNQLTGFGYKGKDVDVEMIPIIKGESWFEKGCTYFTKLV